MNFISYVVGIGLGTVAIPLSLPANTITYEASRNDVSMVLVLDSKIASTTKEVDEIVVECSCIKGARAYGVAIPYGTNAWDIEPNSVPMVDSLVLLDYPNTGHVAVITALTEEGMHVYEENFRNPVGGCRKGYRFIPWGDPAIRGFWTPTEIDVVGHLALRL